MVVSHNYLPSILVILPIFSFSLFLLRFGEIVKFEIDIFTDATVAFSCKSCLFAVYLYCISTIKTVKEFF